MLKIIQISMLGLGMLNMVTPQKTVCLNTEKTITIKSEKVMKLEATTKETTEQEQEQDEPSPSEDTENNEIEEQQVIQNYSTDYETRMTSYWTNDGYETGTCTGSGLCTDSFQTNEYGWYTYQGKLVVATATEYLLKYNFTLAEGVRTYRYYDELTLNIDGVDYPAIVLDSCGSSMKNGRIDLFVSNEQSMKDTQILVKE